MYVRNMIYGIYCTSTVGTKTTWTPLICAEDVLSAENRNSNELVHVLNIVSDKFDCVQSKLHEAS